MYSDYYSILGISSDATQDEIRKAFHEKAKLYHPDVYKGSDGDLKFKLLNEAYRVLINPVKRKKYDFMLKYGFSPSYSAKERDRRRNPYIYEEFLRRKKEQSRYETELTRKLFRRFDRFIFWSLLLIGIAGLIFGLIDLIAHLRITGVLFSVVIAAVMFYSVRGIKKSAKRE